MKVIGYTTGVFDLFHIGHLNVLRNARAKCDELIVGVTTDELTLQRKNKAPVVPYAERAEIVANIRFVDRVVPQHSVDQVDAWHELRFSRLFKGDDWKGSPEWNRWEELLSPLGVEIFYLPYTAHTSSTLLRDVLGKLDAAS